MSPESLETILHLVLLASLAVISFAGTLALAYRAGHHDGRHTRSTIHAAHDLRRLRNRDSRKPYRNHL